MKNPKRTFINRLKALRRKHGWSQYRLAKEAGMSREYLARLELGQQDPTLGTMTKISKAFGVELVELLKAKSRNKDLVRGPISN